MIFFRYTYYRTFVLTKGPSPGGEGEDSPAAKRHPLREGDGLPWPAATGRWEIDTVGFGEVEEGGDGDGSLARRHSVTKASGKLI